MEGKFNVISQQKDNEFFCVCVITIKKNAPYMSVKVFSTKVLIEDTIFTSSTEYGTAILRGHSSHAKDQPLASG